MSDRTPGPKNSGRIRLRFDGEGEGRLNVEFFDCSDEERRAVTDTLDATHKWLGGHGLIEDRRVDHGDVEDDGEGTIAVDAFVERMRSRIAGEPGHAE